MTAPAETACPVCASIRPVVIVATDPIGGDSEMVLVETPTVAGILDAMEGDRVTYRAVYDRAEVAELVAHFDKFGLDVSPDVARWAGGEG